MGRILRTIDIRGDSPTKVSDSDVDRHADSTLVLPSQVISKPAPITRLIFGWVISWKKKAPCDDSRESGVASRNNEEGPEVLNSIGSVRDVDREPNQTK